MRRYPARLALVLALAGVGGCAEMLVPQGSETGILLKEARQGVAESQYQLGLRYTQGVVLKQNYRKGVEQFQKAALQGHPGAKHLLGMAYLTGRGVNQDFTQARQWLEQAAQQGQVAAQYQVGDLYLNGRGVPAEAAWGAYWLGIAADRGHARAQYDLGVVYQAGVGGVQADRALAWKWLKLSEMGGEPQATALLAKLTPQMTRLELKRARYWASNWAAVSATAPSNSHLIRFAQQRLTALGYEPGRIDGILGGTTVRALKLFATEQSLPEASLQPAMVSALRQAKPLPQKG